MKQKRSFDPRATAWITGTCLAASVSMSASAADPQIHGPIPGTPPGDPLAEQVEDTYPFFATVDDLAGNGYVEEEFHLYGEAEAFDGDGDQQADGVPYRTRIVVRRPEHPAHFNGTVLMEWQNVTAGYDLDALWNGDHIMRSGYAWIGVSAQRVGVDQLTEWSPVRYGELDVTGDGAFEDDQLSYNIFEQAAMAARGATETDPMAGLDVERVLGIGASQSAGRMTTYYDNILPQREEAVFDGYGFIVGSAPSRDGDAPVFHVLSETDVMTPLGRRADSEVYRRWEVAGTAHSGHQGQVYREPISERDLADGAPEYDCSNPPFSRAPLHHVTAAAYDHLDNWVAGNGQPPSAPYLEFDGLSMVRNELGLAQGGIQLSQVTAPTALNTGTNSGEVFCFLFGTHEPFDDETLAELYRNHGDYVSQVVSTDNANVEAGYILRDDARENIRDAARSDVGKQRGRQDHPQGGPPGRR